MHITIDTNNITNEDRAILKLVLDQYDTFASDQAAVIQEHRGRVAEQTAPGVRGNPDYVPGGQAEKPKRSRRTNAEIAFDTAKEAHDADPTELAALVSAAEELKAKDPGNERLKGFNPDDFQPTPASEDAESDTAQEETPATEPDTTESVSIEEVTELATKLIRQDRPAMVALLETFGARKVSDVPESDWGKFASEIRAKLA